MRLVLKSISARLQNARGVSYRQGLMLRCSAASDTACSLPDCSQFTGVYYFPAVQAVYFDASGISYCDACGFLIEAQVNHPMRYRRDDLQRHGCKLCTRYWNPNLQNGHSQDQFWISLQLQEAAALLQVGTVQCKSVLYCSSWTAMRMKGRTRFLMTQDPQEGFDSKLLLWHILARDVSR